MFNSNSWTKTDDVIIFCYYDVFVILCHLKIPKNFSNFNPIKLKFGVGLEFGVQLSKDR